jgi:hypothetical protein
MPERSYVGKAMAALRKSGNGLYLGGAAATLATAIPFAKKYAHVFAGLPWQELTKYVQWPLEVVGLGELGLVSDANARDRAEGIAPNLLERTGRVLRCANLATVPAAQATNNDALYSLVIPSGLTVAGHGLEYVGSLFNKQRKNK